MGKTMEENVKEALVEARILEYANDEYNEERVMKIAARLSGQPISVVAEVAKEGY